MSTSTTMKISLPIKMRDDIKKVIKDDARYATASGFLQSIIDRELKLNKEYKKLNTLVQEGLASGVSNTKPRDFFKNLVK